MKTSEKTKELEQNRPLTEDETAQVSGGHSHPRSSVVMARRPGGGMSSYTCEKCGLVLPDAGTYFEHKRMAHGG